MFCIQLKNQDLGSVKRTSYWTKEGPSSTNAYSFRSRGEALAELSKLPPNTGRIVDGPPMMMTWCDKIIQIFP